MANRPTPPPHRIIREGYPRLPDGARYLDSVVIGDHVPVGALCHVENIIMHRKWWQFWKPKWWVEGRTLLCLADRSGLDVTTLDY